MSVAVIKALMRKRYSSPEWALAFEVADATGGNARRSADAVAMNLWPSRGLAIHGFEFKSRRNDWLRELKNPAKAESVAQYCDHWWLVAIQGVVKPGELPSGWGLIEVYGKDGREAFQVLREPEKRLATPVSREFMAALFRKLAIDEAEEFRAAVRIDVSRHIDKVNMDFDARVQRAVEVRSMQYDAIAKRVAEFEETTGIKLVEHARLPKEVGRAVNFVLESGLFQPWGPVSRLMLSLEEVQAQFKAALSGRHAGAEQASEGDVHQARVQGGGQG